MSLNIISNLLKCLGQLVPHQSQWRKAPLSGYPPLTLHKKNSFPLLKVYYHRFRGVVVITLASHARGPEFNPWRNLRFFFYNL